MWMKFGIPHSSAFGIRIVIVPGHEQLLGHQSARCFRPVRSVVMCPPEMAGMGFQDSEDPPV
jgi:hypothetical protein